MVHNLVYYLFVLLAPMSEPPQDPKDLGVLGTKPEPFHGLSPMGSYNIPLRYPTRFPLCYANCSSPFSV
jgi:hypothetical protein